MVPYKDENDEEREYSAPSRSQLKREMTALQKLAEELVDLGPELAKKAPLNDNLLAAVTESFKIKKHEARRRHFQYIGKLMRDIDPQSLQDYIETIRSGRQAQTGAFHELEQWRDRLMEGDDELVEELVERFPDMDIQRFRQMVRNARKERESGKKPKAFRELFRMLRAAQEQVADENAPEA
ncbi:ribosome biogenesis factor YjgA [Salidesulfovibrio onnuriiensis]|uniref:ribosome biogenesis factor YjgA n=1 Tax=Salidesulfovibrio onnuriiensis TaxID=2583823 RepID=UPI0011CC4824|nr:ribosome biogenesis factor YjgA [Salidesulfovibrio onnuriiensis]